MTMVPTSTRTSCPGSSNGSSARTRPEATGRAIGLGLAIVSSIVKAHHGSVSAESGDGRTVFRVRIPMIEKSGPDTA